MLTKSEFKLVCKNYNIPQNVSFIEIKHLGNNSIRLGKDIEGKYFLIFQYIYHKELDKKIIKHLGVALINEGKELIVTPGHDLSLNNSPFHYMDPQIATAPHFLKKLLNGEPCGDYQFDAQGKMTEGPVFLDQAKTIPVFKIL